MFIINKMYRQVVSLRDTVIDTSRIAGAVSSIIFCTGLVNDSEVKSVEKVPKYFGLDLRLCTQLRY